MLRISNNMIEDPGTKQKLSDKLASVDSLIGNVTTLTTNAKTSVVAAINENVSSLADKAKQTFINVKDYGAIADGNSHPLSSIYTTLSAAQAKYSCATALTDEIDWCAIQQAYNDVSAYSTIFLPKGTYRINKTLTFNKQFVNVEGANKFTSGLVYYGSQQAIMITASQTSYKKFYVQGLGGVNGVGATNTYGIEVSSAQELLFEEIGVSLHGSHGIYFVGDVWTIVFLKCRILDNLGDGINCLSVDSHQCGNAVQIIASSIIENSGNGVVWSATQLLITGCNIERNLKSGIKINSVSGSPINASSATITGNYFEQNRYGQIWFRCDAGITACVVNGNYFMSTYVGSDGATALVIANGVAWIEMDLGYNYYTISGSTLVNFVDLGTMPRSSSRILSSTDDTKFVNIGSGRLNYRYKNTVISGFLQSKGGITYPDVTHSVNVKGLSDQTVYFILPVKPGDIVNAITLRCTSDGTTSYSIVGTITGYNSNGIASNPQTSSVTKTGTGDTTLSFGWTDTYSPFRLNENEVAIIKFAVTPPTDGTNMYIYNPIVTIIG